MNLTLKIAHRIQSKTIYNKLNTNEESQKPSVTKSFPVGSNHDAKLSYRDGSQKIKLFSGYFMLKNQSVWLLNEFLGHNSRSSLLNYLKWLFETNLLLLYATYTAQKIKFSIKDFLSKCDQIRSFLRIWLHLLKKSLMENFIF